MEKISSKSQIFYINKSGGLYVDADNISNKDTIVVNDGNIRDAVNAALQKYGSEADLNFIDVSNVTVMDGLFAGVTFNGSVSNWNVSNVRCMNGIFKNSIFKADISKWTTSSLTSIDDMCAEAVILPDLSLFDTSHVVSMARAFESTPTFSFSLSKWNVSKAKNLFGVFSNSKFNGDIAGWDLSSAMNTACMFLQSSFGKDIGSWNMASVREMSYMFYGASRFSANLEKWKPSPIAKMNDMFTGSKLEKTPPSWYKGKR